MSYNNRKNRIKERVYSVTMTEDELKLFSEFLEQREFESRKEVWEREKKEEQERNKERDEIIKKLPKEDQEHAEKMWQDADSAGRIATRVRDRDNGYLGAGAGYLVAKVGKKVAKNAGKTVKHGKLITAGAMIAGSNIAKRAGWKKSERIGQDIWNEGDRRLMEFIKSDKKTREKMKKEYEPIDCFWRKENKKED